MCGHCRERVKRTKQHTVDILALGGLIEARTALVRARLAVFCLIGSIRWQICRTVSLGGREPQEGRQEKAGREDGVGEKNHRKIVSALALRCRRPT